MPVRASPARRPSLAFVNGVWTGSASLVGVDGGDCIGDGIRTAVGKNGPLVLTVQQSGSHLTATDYSPNNPAGTFSYSGTVDANTLTLTWDSCSICNLSAASCTNGAVRDTHMLSGMLTATTDGRTMSGSDIKVYNVFLSGSMNVVGVMTGTSTFSLTKQ